MKCFLTILLFTSWMISTAQSIDVTVYGIKLEKVYLYSLQGEKTTLVDSLFPSAENKDRFNRTAPDKLHIGFYRILFSNNRMIDFVYDGKDVKLETDARNIQDSLKVISSGSNRLFYSFLNLNRKYKTKIELLQLIIARFPKDDSYYISTKKRLHEINNEYSEFINQTSQKNKNLFIAKYIRSVQLPVIDEKIRVEKQLDYLRSHSLDNVDFNNSMLINSDAFTNKTIEYLTYYRNPQLSKEQLEKEFVKAVDTLLNKAKVNQLVYQHITEYLIDGFKKFGFDAVLDYIVENYVIKDDLCLDVKTEGLIKRRIDQAKILKIGNITPDIILTDINEKQICLSKLNCERTLIVFYASWCPHCKELMPKLNVLMENRKDRKIEVLAISLDDKKEDWKGFVKENCSSLINVSDFQGWNGKAANDFKIYATPTMFIIDNQQQIISKPMTIDDVKKFL